MKTFAGTVAAVNTAKTAKVEIKSIMKHAIYKKVIKKSRVLHVDTNNLKVSLGDSVVISECRPISKTKNFKIIKVNK